jgi:hypothetical protein
VDQAEIGRRGMRKGKTLPNMALAAMLLGAAGTSFGAVIDFAGGTATLGNLATVTTDDSTVYGVSGPGVDYYEEDGFRVDFFGGNGIVGNYYGTGNAVLHAHWASGEFGDVTSILVSKIDGAPFNLDYFVLTSNTDNGGAAASGNEQTWITASNGFSQLLPSEDWGPAGSNPQIFLDDNFDNITWFSFSATNAVDCFGMDSICVEEASPTPGSSEHTLTIGCTGSGTVEMIVVSAGVSTTLSGDGPFALTAGAQVTITATAAAGWRFMGWSGSIGSVDRVILITLTEDLFLTASFAQDPRTLTVTCGEGGKVVRPGAGAFIFERGTTVPIEATPDSSYHFAGWTGTLVLAGYVAEPAKNRTQVVLNETGTVHASFEQGMRQFYESWETAAVGTYSPATGTYLDADEGPWAWGDGVAGSRLCGSQPHTIKVLKLASGNTLRVTSTDTKSICTDTVWLALDESGLKGNGPALAIDATTVLSFYEVGQLDAPGLHGSGKDCGDPPCFDNVSLLLTDNRGNQLAYVLQRPAGVTANVPNANLGGTYREVFLDPSGIYYQRNLATDFATIPAFDPRNPEIWTIKFRVAEHGSAIIDQIAIGPDPAGGRIPVYHFWSPTLQTHFFTIAAQEKQYLIDTWPYIWTFEGISYFTSPQGSDPNLTPVYRFWSPTLSSHFYTISEDERDFLVHQFPDVWSLEGIAFYVFAEGRQPADATPVYRFWSPSLGCHFYTADPNECDDIVRDESATWTLEGTAWYAYPPDWDSAQALDILAGR